MALEGQLVEELVNLGELRAAAEREAPEPVRWLIVEAIDQAVAEIENAAAMATAHRPPTALAVELARTERERETGRVICGEGFSIIGAVS